jgi:hypothetical protein
MIPSESSTRPTVTHPSSCTPPSAPNERHASDAEITEAAERIKETGEWFWGDDYDKRTDAFASEMGKLDTESRAKLWTAVAESDPGAFNHWLSPERLNNLVESGTVSPLERGVIAEGFAAAYNRGEISYDQASQFLQTYNATEQAPDFRTESLGAIETFLGSSCGPEMTRFREDFGREMLRQEVDAVQNPGNAFPRPLASGLAVKIMADSGDSDMVARAYASFDASERAILLDSVAEGSTGYLNSGSVNFDPLSTLIESVGHRSSDSRLALDYTTGSGVRYGDSFGTMANEIVQFAADNKEYFFDRYDSTKPIDSRAESMGTLLNGHRDTILDRFANLDMKAAYGEKGANPELVNNAVTLGNLFRLTTLNSDNSNQPANLNAVTDYAMNQKEALINDPNGNDVRTRLGRLAMLGSSMFNGIEQGYMDLAKDEAATKALVGFVVDVALAAVPLSKFISDGGKEAVSGVFKNKAIDDALGRVTGAVIDSSTGKLTAAGKAAIVEALGPEAGGLEAQKAVVNAIMEHAIYEGLPGLQQSILDGNILAINATLALEAK